MDQRGIPVQPAMAVLKLISGLVRIVDADAYKHCDTLARRRIAQGDEADWPILATALALQCPIWTEDTDFFGCGVATWTTDCVELYLGKTS